jgi:hypothetical protein
VPTYRVLWIDISRLCIDTADIVLKALGDKSVAYNFDAGKAAINLPDTPDIQTVRELISDALSKSPKKDDYLVVDNAGDETRISVLRQGDIEELGLYLCSLCAMIFGSKEEKVVHERSHLFGFAF